MPLRCALVSAAHALAGDGAGITAIAYAQRGWIRQPHAIGDHTAAIGAHDPPRRAFTPRR
jgi:hypothetical protein